MKHAGYVAIAILVLYTFCAQNAEPVEILLRYQGVVEYEDYWWGLFEVDSGVLIEMNHISNHRSDVLLIDREGLTGFERRIDEIWAQTWKLETN
jgi:hypothetical protein